MSGPLAVVGKVIAVYPIPGADFIQRAEVICGPSEKWSGVVSKDIQPDAMVTVFLQDALPTIGRMNSMKK